MLPNITELPDGVTIRGQNGERYIIEGVLGKGKESIVYQVRDRRAKNRVFALKEFINPPDEARMHLRFEADLFTRLDHPSFPHIYKVFENVELRRVYMLMDYVMGKDLEVLRKEQPEERFSLQLTLILLEPIFNAVQYLHHQTPPIIHRDIKPANMIVPVGGGEAMLVDFGIAKEQDMATSNFFRNGTPGYAAPEQYGEGTNQQTDIYAFGATLYTLLTGKEPIDGLKRSVELKKGDPLKPMRKVNPEIPIPVSDVIERAMRLRYEERYATIDEFWFALKQAAKGQLALNAPASDKPALPFTVSASDVRKPLPVRALHRSSSLFTRRPLISITLSLLVLLLLAGGIGGFIFSRNQPTPAPASIHSTPSIQKPAFVSVPNCPLPPFVPTSPVSPQGIQVFPAYGGTISNNVASTSTNNQGTPMCFADVRQNGQNISGKFGGLGFISTFKGTVTQERIKFTVPIGNDRTYSFEGGIRSGGDMGGSYQVLDNTGQSLGESGLWEVIPVKTHTQS
jgi:serine/threonine protein kinase